MNLSIIFVKMSTSCRNKSQNLLKIINFGEHTRFVNIANGGWALTSQVVISTVNEMYIQIENEVVWQNVITSSQWCWSRYFGEPKTTPLTNASWHMIWLNWEQQLNSDVCKCEQLTWRKQRAVRLHVSSVCCSDVASGGLCPEGMYAHTPWPPAKVAWWSLALLCIWPNWTG